MVREITVAELRGRGAQVVLDVRGREEFAAGHLPGAVNVPIDELAAVAPRYRGRTVVTVCRSGQRSALAARVLDAAGAHVWSLAGGTVAWRDAGHPIEREVR